MNALICLRCHDNFRQNVRKLIVSLMEVYWFHLLWMLSDVSLMASQGPTLMHRKTSVSRGHLCCGFVVK